MKLGKIIIFCVTEIFYHVHQLSNSDFSESMEIISKYGCHSFTPPIGTSSVSSHLESGMAFKLTLINRV